MSRTLSLGLAAHVAGSTTTIARCARLDLFDGTRIALTDHDRNLTIDLGDGVGAISYSASTGVLPSAVSLSVGLDSDSVELHGPLGDTITAAQVLGGRLNRADVYLFDVNWASLAQGPARLLKGKISEPRIEGGEFVAEVRGLQDAFNQAIGRILSPQCGADYGDAKCAAVPAVEFVTVASVIDEMTITVTFPGAVPADDFFNEGKVTFTSGGLAGTRPIEVAKFTSGARRVTLYVPMPDLPQVGDALTLMEGCSKTWQACRDRDNILNFRGFRHVPGNDKYLSVPTPGQP